jgi:hypothetical protein
MASCGGPQEFVSPNEPRHSAGPYEGDPCAVGATGPDCDNDGLTDACETSLGTPPCNADCDADGIPDNRDDIKDCLAPGDPKKDPDYTDPTQDANRDRMLQELSSGLLLGNASISGKAPSGTKITLQDQKLRVVPSGADIFGGRCGAQFILLTISGLVGYCQASVLDPGTQCSPTMAQATIRLCAPVTIPSQLMIAYPEGYAPLSITGKIPGLKWAFAEMDNRAMYQLTALYNGKDPWTTDLTLTVNHPAVIPIQCPNATNPHLYDQLKTEWTTKILEKFLGVRICEDPDCEKYSTYTVDGGTTDFNKNWKRTGSTAQVCEAPGALGNWVNSD